MLKSKGIISNFQKEILFCIAKTKDSRQFYLAGGTALAEFYFAHRKSFDLDLFTNEKNFIVPFSRSFEGELKDRFLAKVIRRFETFVEFEITRGKDAVKVQFAYDSPFRFKRPENSDLGIKVNSYKDLIVDKLLAFFGRVEPRDAVDLFFILKKEDLWHIAKLASQKDPGFDLYWLAIALEKTKDFPDEITEWPVEMIKKADAREVKNTFSEITKKIMLKINGKRS